LTVAPLLAITIGHLMILPLTWLSVRWLGVPERDELVAGVFLTVVYALLASPLGGALLR
jgi:hypothetical protein